MKQIALNIVIILWATIALASPSDSLQKANELYSNNEFEKALSMYQQLVAEKYSSATLFYNLGNSYYKTGNITKAIINYERALLLAPNNNDIKYNLALANQYIVDKIEPLPTPFFVKWWRSIVNLSDTDGWAKTSIAAFVLMLVFALFFFVSGIPGVKKTTFSLAIVMLVFSLLTLLFTIQQNQQIKNRTHAIIVTPTVTVKASPNESGTDLFVIHEGLKVNITNQVNNWVEIRLEDGNSGWVNPTVLEKI
ncbi:MAG TPA: tetratricopeptide repeat protein [Prolixibacteraceae bacterium]|nr:tetratricopeptide repeat protein [Prolixibacteraceae bacterium]HPR60556.1 tetratricopeptide repeat protein [Prolixibacteraceae bacterium]